MQLKAWLGPLGIELNSGINSGASPVNTKAKAKKGRTPEEIRAHAEDVKKYAFSQFEAFVNFPRNKSCMFTSLADDEPDYVEGYIVFLKSLLQHTPSFDYPILLMHGIKGKGLHAKTQAYLRSVYPKTFFIKPMIPPFVPYNHHFSFENGEHGVQFSSEADTNMFYYRLQLFTYSFCKNVVHMDAGDMLVQDDVSNLFQDDITKKAGFAAAPICERKQYFNAGLYVVGKPFLSARAYENIIRVAVNMPRPSLRTKRAVYSWQADQDVLNVYFHLSKYLTISYKYNYSKRNVYGGLGMWIPNKKLQSIGVCNDITHPHIIHYVGPKPWLPINSRRNSQDKDLHTRQIEMYWWRAYLRDKTLVLGSGPSLLEHKIGSYINMFQNVIRVNNFDLGNPEYLGAKTTHVVVHMATKPANFTGIRKKNILFAAFENYGKFDMLQKRVNEPSGTKLDLKGITMLDKWYFEGLATEANIEKGRHPLTGTIAVAWAVREFSHKPIFVAGFDLMFGATEYAHYQSGEKVSPASIRKFHDAKHDAAYFRKLEHAGLIRQLKIY